MMTRFSRGLESCLEGSHGPKASLIIQLDVISLIIKKIDKHRFFVDQPTVVLPYGSLSNEPFSFEENKTIVLCMDHTIRITG